MKLEEVANSFQDLILMSKFLISLAVIILLVSAIYSVCEKTLVTSQDLIYMKKQVLQTRKLQKVSPQTLEYILDIPYFEQVSLLVYVLALRIVGIENLFIWQIIHVFQAQTQNYYLPIGEFIHGYTNPSLFALQDQGYSYLFSKINLIWQLTVIMFMISIGTNLIITPCYKNLIINLLEKQTDSIEVQPILIQSNITQQTEENIHAKISGITKKSINLDISSPKKTLQTLSSKMTQQRRLNSLLTQADSILNDGSIYTRYKFEQDETKKMQFTQKKIENSLKNTKQAKVSDTKEDNIRKKHKKYKKMITYSNTLLKQVVFDLLINSICILVYGLIQQYKNHQHGETSLSNVSFSGCIIFLSEFVIFMIVFNFLCDKQKGAGQNVNKFKRQSFGKGRIYWIINIMERVLYSLLIGSGWTYSIAFISFLKFCVMVFAKFSKLWIKPSDYYRNLVTHFIHFLVLLVVCLDFYYLSNSNKIRISRVTIAWIILGLLSSTFFLSLVFFLQEIGLFSWIKKIKSSITLKNSGDKTENEVQNKSQIKHQNQNKISNASQMQNGKHVKFIQKNKNEYLKPIQQLQKAKTSNNLPGQKTQKQKLKPNLKRSKVFQTKTQGLIQNSGQRQTQQKQHAFMSGSQKQITKLSDAARAQKTKRLSIEKSQMVIFEKAHQDNESSNDMDLIWIKCSKAN